MELGALIQLANNALKQDQEAEQTLVAIERYTEAFTTWYRENETRLSTLNKDQLLDLEGKHETLLELARHLQGAVQGDMRTLKSKAKGIMAYEDVFPRRISISRDKKG